MEYADFAPFTFLSLLVIAIILALSCIRYRYKYWEHRNIPHFSPVIPSGNMKEWMRSKHSSEIFSQTYHKYKNKGYLFAGFYFYFQRAVIALDLELVRYVLVRNVHAFQDRGLFHNEKDDPFTGNLYLLDGPKWKSLRTKLASTFANCKIKYIFPTVLNVGDALKKAFDEQIIESKDGVFDVTYILNRFSCDVIANCVFGMDSCSLDDPNTRFYVMARTFFSKRRHTDIVDNLINCFPLFAKFLRMKVIPQEVTKYFLNMFKASFDLREQSETKRADFLDLLIDLNRKLAKKDEELTIEELAAQAFSFFITAYDTCSATVSCALYELARRPDIQQKLRQEINITLKTHKYTMTYDCLKDMKYLDQVISETLRKYPANPSLFRKCTKLFFPPHKPHYHIERGCTVIIPVVNIHYDSRYYPNPYDFNPDRFSPNSPKLPSCAYLPFGDGQRNCIGMRFARMQIGIALYKLIKHFRFEVCSKTKNPVELVIPALYLVPINVALKVKKI